jgi:glucuronate isomerase
MQPFIHDDFLLSCDASVRLFHEYAANEPILDYHCHLPPADLAGNRRFANLFEIWLAGDHYKWRAMRTNGVHERFCTGDAAPREKFMAWAATVPHTLRNPLYHWTHLELKRYFGIDDLLDESTAPRIWDIANEQLAGDRLTAWGILNIFDVRGICTTDDPTDSLAGHKAIAEAPLKTRVYPTFRPDKALTIGNPPIFNAWVDNLAGAADTDINNFSRFLIALDQRHAAFHASGCRLSDHGLETCFSDYCDEAEAARIFDQARAGSAVTPDEADRFCGLMMETFGRMDAERGWTKQLHLGAMRNNNTRMLSSLGPDTGFDSIGDWPQAKRLAHYLDRLDQQNSLPRTIIYNLNPADNDVFATMIGNFQDGSIAGKVQFGSGWWFLDQLEGMRQQLDALSNSGLLSRFVGMLTDSRSFMSYPRHEYFRRLLCNILGRDINAGRLPRDFDLIGQLVCRVCYANARDYLCLEIDDQPEN